MPQSQDPKACMLFKIVDYQTYCWS